MYYYTKCNMAVSYKTQEPCTLGECLGSPPGFDLVRIDHMTCVVFFRFLLFCVCFAYLLLPNVECVMTAPPV
jgi:hypothetical protein